MKFKCCGNASTAGHAVDCSLSPPSNDALASDDAQADPGLTRAGLGASGSQSPEQDENKEGCQFDLQNFEHIGECAGTCGDQEGDIGMEVLDEDGDIIEIVIIEFDSEEDMAKAIAKLQELERQGKIKKIPAGEVGELIQKAMNGKVRVKKMSADEFLKGIEKDQFLRDNPPGSDDEPGMDEDPYLDIKQAAEALGFSPGWTRTLCRKGKLPGAIKLMRKWAIPRSAIFEED